MSIRVFLADEHKVTCQTLRCILGREPDFEIVGEARTAPALFALVEHSQPDVVIMDITLREINSVEAVCELRQCHPATKLICFSLTTVKSIIVDMLRAGASGFVSKKCPASELARAIRTVYAGGIYISPDIGGVFLDEIRQMDEQAHTLPLAHQAIT